MPARKPPRRVVGLIQQVKRLKDLIKEGEAELKGDDGLQSQLIAEMRAMGMDSVVVTTDEGTKLSCSIVQASSEVVNEEELVKCLDEDTWMSITKRVVDKGLLEDALATGVVAPGVIAACSSTVTKKPYVLINEAAKKEATPIVRAGRAPSEAARKIRRNTK